MKIIFLVRHGSHAELGRVLSGRSEIELSPQGQAEARDLVWLFDGQVIASLHSSPRHRALQTIAPVATHRRLQVRTAHALDEVDFGRFAGHPFTALDEDDAWRQWNDARATTRCPGGETMGEAVSRARAYLLALSSAEAPALCVTHCDIIRGLVAEATGIGLAGLLGLDCAPGSITMLDASDGTLRLVPYGATAPA